MSLETLLYGVGGYLVGYWTGRLVLEPLLDRWRARRFQRRLRALGMADNSQGLDHKALTP